MQPWKRRDFYLAPMDFQLGVNGSGSKKDGIRQIVTFSFECSMLKMPLPGDYHRGARLIDHIQ